MSEGRRLIKNTGIIAIGNISTKLVSFFLLPLYTSILTTVEYGVIDYILSVTIILVPFVTLLMDEAIFRYLIDCKTEEDKKRVISNSFAIILGGIVVFSLFAIPILLYLQYNYSIYLLLYVLTNSLVTMVSAFLRGIGHIKQYAVYNFFCSALQIVLNVILIVVLKMRVYGMLNAYIISGIAVSVFYLIKVKIWKYIDFRKCDKKVAEDMIKYSLPLIPNRISWTIINVSDRIIVMNFVGGASAGLYAVSNRFPSLMDTVYGFFYQSWKESSARALNNNESEDFYNYVYKHLKSFLFAMVVGLTAFMPLLFAILIDSSFSKAIVYVPFLLLATYFMNISGFYGGIFTAYKDTKIMGTTTIAAAVINLLVNISLIWKLGLYAAAVSTLVANFVVYEYRKIKIKKYIRLNENKIANLLAIAVIAIIWSLFYMNRFIYLIIGGCIAVVYAIVTNLELIRILIKSISRN
ncbi:MAG: oligosaccharide flippase family protein [Lachnospiraceae bacterium]|nr:oligosaccharide flippase family protein [Lachnospiraceae bacterium]